MIRLGIIGVGNMGSGHAANVRDGKCPDFAITAIADINPARLSWAKEQKYGEEVAYLQPARARRLRQDAIFVLEKI